jgi:hypothetical protein
MLKIALAASLAITALAFAAPAGAQSAAQPQSGPAYGGAGTGTPSPNIIPARPAPGSAVTGARSADNPASPNARERRTGRRTLDQCRAMSPSALRSDPVCSKMMSGRSPH